MDSSERGSPEAWHDISFLANRRDGAPDYAIANARGEYGADVPAESVVVINPPGSEPAY